MIYSRNNFTLILYQTTLSLLRFLSFVFLCSSFFFLMPLQLLHFRSAIQSGPCIAATFVLFSVFFFAFSHCEYILFSTWMSDKEECYLLYCVHADDLPPRDKDAFCSSTREFNRIFFPSVYALKEIHTLYRLSNQLNSISYSQKHNFPFVNEASVP